MLKKRHARAALQFAEESSLTPKQHVLIADPDAHLDYYEVLRGAGKPCWFIRRGLQGNPYTLICGSPRAAWKAAFDGLLIELRKAAA
jgi:hypothetical protein